MSATVQFSSVELLSCVRLFATPWIAACQASLSIANSWSLLKLMSIESVMPSSHLILCRPLLLLAPIPPSIRVFYSANTKGCLSLSVSSYSLSPNCCLMIFSPSNLLIPYRTASPTCLLHMLQFLIAWSWALPYHATFSLEFISTYPIIWNFIYMLAAFRLISLTLRNYLLSSRPVYSTACLISVSEMSETGQETVLGICTCPNALLH